MKERGQLAYEAVRTHELPIVEWGDLRPANQDAFAAMERAVRNAALEEAALILDAKVKDRDELVGDYQPTLPMAAYESVLLDRAATAIRALIEEPK